MLKLYINIDKLINKKMESNFPHKTDAIVGSLLLWSFENGSMYRVASWYRITDQGMKIVKMQRIKGHTNISYRCTVFDIGAMIELRLELKNNQEANSGKYEQIKSYGPVKFDAYLSKQLQQSKHNYSFIVGIHLKCNRILPCKVKTNIKESGEIQLHIQNKKEQVISLIISSGTDWRMFEDIFSIESSKLTDICLKEIFDNETVKSQFKELSINLEGKNYLIMTFVNVVQRNLFLAQIIKMLMAQMEGRPSDVKSIVKSDDKNNNNIENEVDDLFCSKPSLKNSILSQKIYNDFKDVVFTPQSGLSRQEEQRDNREKFFTMFDQFLNPEDVKDEGNHKLTDIVQEQNQYIRQSKTKITKKSNRCYTDNSQFSQSQHSPKSKRQRGQVPDLKHKTEQQRNKYIKKILEQNVNLSYENKKLRKENRMLRKKLQKSNVSTPKSNYDMPKFFKAMFAKNGNSCKLTDQTQCKSIQDQSKRETKIEPTINQKQSHLPCFKKIVYREDLNRKCSRSSQRQQYEEDLKKKYEKISMSTKTVKRLVLIDIHKDK